MNSIEPITVRDRILEIVDEKHGAYWGDFVSGMPDTPHDAIQAALRGLILDGTLRQKDDDQEHDWEYVRRRQPARTATASGATCRHGTLVGAICDDCVLESNTSRGCV